MHICSTDTSKLIPAKCNIIYTISRSSCCLARVCITCRSDSPDVPLTNIASEVCFTNWWVVATSEAVM
uniref:Uncharacterized protein n=1 Tax=Arundo donax TaxID=35708 RepID=A0A0A9E0B5_ARUDO